MTRDTDAARPRALIGESGMAEVVAVAPDPILLHREGQVIYVNGAALAALGYDDAEQVLGQNVLDTLVHPDDAKVVVERMARMTGPRPATTQPPVLVRFRRRDESIAWLEASAAKVELGDGPATMVLAQDVSQARAQAQRFRTLFAVTAELETDDPASFERALAAVAEELGCDAAILSRISGPRYVVEHVHAPGFPLEREQEFQLGNTYCALTVEAGDVLAIHDMGHSEHRGHPCYAAFSLETYIGVRIRVAGDVYGTLNFSSPERRRTPWSDDDCDLVRMLGKWMGRAIEARLGRRALAVAHDEMQRLATIDPLTGLPNRRAATARLRREVEKARRGIALTVGLADLDHFKRVNDTHGHDAGDRVLVAAAHAMTGALRGMDQVYRWGGEEFLILLPETRLAPATSAAERLRAAVEARRPLDGVTTTISIGLAEVAAAESAQDLLKRADAALYSAKEAGRNRVASAS